MGINVRNSRLQKTFDRGVVGLIDNPLDNPATGGSVRPYYVGGRTTPPLPMPKLIMKTPTDYPPGHPDNPMTANAKNKFSNTANIYFARRFWRLENMRPPTKAKESKQ